ncbi:hypothetical protein ACHQM5_021569 [Ranunculus cassubicifolius]
MATSKLSIKLLVDKKANRVLFAEAGKDFVDFLFSLLSLPVGSVIRLLTKSKMVGCIGNLYESVKTLDETYILQPKINKNLLLTPKPAAGATLNVPLLTQNDSSVQTTETYYYSCNSQNNNDYVYGSGNSIRHFYVSNDSNSICPSCGRKMTTQLTFVGSKNQPVTTSSSSTDKGYVKGVVTYMVMDDLTVMPMSTISSITLLNKFNIENVGLLEERMVDLDMQKGLELLKVSLQSKTALSEVFLGKKAI